MVPEFIARTPLSLLPVLATRPLPYHRTIKVVSGADNDAFSRGGRKRQLSGSKAGRGLRCAGVPLIGRVSPS